MAETEAEPAVNGTGGLSAEEEDERLKQRPADIDADVREMERRKRVEAIMSSKMFREELERVLDQQLNEGGGAAPLLQQIREMVGSAGAARFQSGAFKGGNCVLPINDIRGIEGMGYEKGEKILRCKLAAVYRLVDLYGWTQGLSGQITARLNTAVEHFLAAPRGLLQHEVTASSLVKVDMQGAVIDQGTTNFPVNLAGFSLHACVHAARPDVRCVLHVRSPAALAVSAHKHGLLPLCSEAALLGDLAYHHLPPGALDNEERDKLVRALGPSAKVLVLSNGGALCCGETLEEAFYQAKCLTAACDVQLRLAGVPIDNLCLLDDETRKQMYDASRKPPADGVKWRVGGEEFEALMRMLDNAGFRTGYIYRHPLVKGDVPKPRSDVEVPPAVSSLGYLLEEEELYRQGLWKKIDGRKTGDRTRWLNSPNVYQKVEVLETGTNDPKKITKWVDSNNEEWVQDGSPAHSSTPVKIDGALQFVPKNTNPKEFKKLQQQLKDNRRADKISAGPQSHILEGVTWDEANKLNAEDAAATHTGDHVVLMGAASKGIIQRGYQHNATVYSAPYAKNPFDQVTDRDLDDYKKTVERKARGEYDTDLSESEAVSAAQITSPATETEEESRDDHRILRIETKQAPRPSQPEVVLSDDSSDFLNAERRSAQRSTPKGDSAIFSEDDVFFDNPASSVTTSQAPAGVVGPVQVHAGGGVLADGSLILRSYKAPVQQTVARDKVTRSKHASRMQDPKINQESVYNINKRALHDFPRTPTFQNVKKSFESPNFKSNYIQDSTLKHSTRPKCKTSLDARLVYSDEAIRTDALEVFNAGFYSDRSSLYSMTSDWESGRKIDYSMRTRSLPRTNRARGTGIYRTRSHAGFINSYLNDPEPNNFHLPRCNSCGAFNNSYAWEISRERSRRYSDSSDNTLRASDSTINLPKKCLEFSLDGKTPKTDIVKVRNLDLPDHFVKKVIIPEHEFVESQEFNEDCYLGDIGNSFSSENQTVIEKKSECTDKSVKSSPRQNEELCNIFDKVLEELKDKFDSENGSQKDTVNSLDAQMDSASERTEEGHDPINGLYLNFSDEFDFDDAVYVSPVRNLVEKDIRNYTVPMTLYCEDFDKSQSTIKSPTKIKGTILEPIMEESRSSNEDSLTNANSISVGNNGQPKEPDVTDRSLSPLAEETEKDVDNKNIASLNDIEISHGLSETVMEIVTIVDDIVIRAFTAVQIKTEILTNVIPKITNKIVETEYLHNKVHYDYFEMEEASDFTTNDIETFSDNILETAMEQYAPESYDKKTVGDCSLESSKRCCSDMTDTVYENVIELLTSEAISSSTSIIDNEITGLFDKNNNPEEVIFKVPKVSDVSKSYISSVRNSYDSIVEFETLEAVSEILGSVLERISFEVKNVWMINEENKEIFRRNLTCHFRYRKLEHKEFEDGKIGEKDEENAQNLQKEQKKTDTFDTVTAESITDYSQNNSNRQDLSNDEEIINDEKGENVNININNIIEEETLHEKGGFGDALGSCNKHLLEQNNGNDRQEQNSKTKGEKECDPNISEDVLDELNHKCNVLPHFMEAAVKLLQKHYLNMELQDPFENLIRNTAKNIDVDLTDDEVALPINCYGFDDFDCNGIESDNFEAKQNFLTENEKYVLGSQQIEINPSLLLGGFSWNDSEYCTCNPAEADNEIDDGFDDINLPENVKSVVASVIGIDDDEKNVVDNFDLCDDDVRQNVSDVQFHHADLPNLDNTSSKENKTLLVEIKNADITVADGLNKDLDVACVEIGSFEKSFDSEILSVDLTINSEITNFTNPDTSTDSILHNIFDVAIALRSDMTDLNDIVTENMDSIHFTNPMDTAFVEEMSSYHGNVTSSPLQKAVYSIDACNESPINNDVPERSLYEREDSILGSPFIKKASVITMSHTAQKGGVKFWVSFDDSLSSMPERSVNRRVRSVSNVDDRTPGFVAAEFSNRQIHNSSESGCSTSMECVNDLTLIESYEVDKYSEILDAFDFSKNNHRISIFTHSLNEHTFFEKNVNQNALKISDTNESFMTANTGSTTYVTCSPSLLVPRNISAENMSPEFHKQPFLAVRHSDLEKKGKKLIYDNTAALKKRRGFSWPPFEKTLFYRILTQFRMSESFDRSEFESIQERTEM